MECGEEISKSLLDKSNEILQEQSKILETIAENSDKAYDKQLEYIYLLWRCLEYLVTFNGLFDVNGLDQLIKDINESYSK